MRAKCERFDEVSRLHARACSATMLAPQVVRGVGAHPPQAEGAHPAAPGAARRRRRARGGHRRLERRRRAHHECDAASAAVEPICEPSVRGPRAAATRRACAPGLHASGHDAGRPRGRPPAPTTSLIRRATRSAICCCLARTTAWTPLAQAAARTAALAAADGAPLDLADVHDAMCEARARRGTPRAPREPAGEEPSSRRAGSVPAGRSRHDSRAALARASVSRTPHDEELLSASARRRTYAPRDSWVAAPSPFLTRPSGKPAATPARGGGRGLGHGAGSRGGGGGATRSGGVMRAGATARAGGAASARERPRSASQPRAHSQPSLMSRSRGDQPPPPPPPPPHARAVQSKVSDGAAAAPRGRATRPSTTDGDERTRLRGRKKGGVPCLNREHTDTGLSQSGPESRAAAARIHVRRSRQLFMLGTRALSPRVPLDTARHACRCVQKC